MPSLGFILSAFGWLKKAATAALGFIVKYPWQTALIVALIAVAWLWRANGNLRDGIKAERGAHAQTVANYRAAATKAEDLQNANLIRVAQAYTDINERKTNALEADRASADARYRRLLANVQSARSAPSHPDMPASMESACRSFEASGCDGLSAKLKAAQDNTDQLVRLIEAVEEQQSVNTSPGGPQ